MKNILVIEDWAPIAKAIKALLEGAGHTVTWLVGASAYQNTDGGFILSGLTADGQTVTIDCRQFQLAFVDGQLLGAIQGPELVNLLVHSNVVCLGMSTETRLNNEMMAVGATMAFKKPVVLAGLLSDKLSVEAVFAPTRSIVSRLNFLQSRFTTAQFTSLRNQTDACIEPFLVHQ